MGLIFFGNERLANSVDENGVILKSLIDSDYEVTHLIINRGERRSRTKHEDVVVMIAKHNNIEVIDEWNQDRIIDLAKQSDAGVLASFGRIIKSDVISAFKHGIVNVHPSLLPLYRGPTPIESAILGNDKKTGVSLMALDDVMDAGNIYASAELELNGDESKQDIYYKLAKMGAQLLIDQLPSILDGTNKGQEQDHSKATFTKLIIKSDGEIDWDQPARIVYDEIRAFLGWPGSKTPLAGKDITITKARLSDANGTPGEYQVIDKEIQIYCGQGSIVIEKLKPAGKSEMTSGAFLAGNQI
jgi:methionyl-tRNA formyltransferase